MNDSPNLTDEELVQRVQNGSEFAFNELVDRHSDMVYRQARAISGSVHEVEDIVQETFLKVFKYIDRFSPSKASFKTWLLTIARNQSINVFSSLKRKAVRLFAEQEIEGGDWGSPTNHMSTTDAESLLSIKQEFSRVTAALKKIPERQRTALLLKAQENMSYEEIAIIMQTSASAVESLIFRARKTILEIVKD
ncbi:MAG: RNA polymerase sigma factor [Desulfomonilaceae bacterium]